MKKIFMIIAIFCFSIGLAISKPGDPIKCVDAKCTNESGKSFNGTIDPAGLFKFTNLPDGKYKAVITTISSDGKTKKPMEFSFEVKAPRDLATGQASGKREAGSGMATGKRQHKPFVVTKDWGVSQLNCTIDNGDATGAIIEK